MKRKRSYITDKDVSMRITYRYGRQYVNLIFRNGAGGNITEGKSYIETLIDNDRVYFVGNSFREGGSKISHVNKNLDYMVTSTADKDLVKWVLKHSDNYDLEYDNDIKMYYIEAREKFL